MTNEKIINLLNVENDVKAKLIKGVIHNEVRVYTATDFLTKIKAKQDEEQDVDYSELIDRVSDTDAYVIHTISGKLYVISENENGSFETTVHENF